MLINCSECGKQVSDKASNCPSCGNPISVNSESKKFCTECGKQISEKDVVCPFCGNPANDNGNINGNKSFERNIPNGKEAFEKRIDEYKANKYRLVKRSGDTVKMAKFNKLAVAVVIIVALGVMCFIPVFIDPDNGVAAIPFVLFEILVWVIGLTILTKTATVIISLTQTGGIEETGNILK
jgi:uncharacterized membrane protein YvbJ